MGAKSKIINYCLIDGTKTLYVNESYNCNLSESVPEFVQIWGIENGQRFHVSIRSLVSRPTIDELKAFGIREYVETE